MLDDHKLLSLTPERLEILRQNAARRGEAELVRRIETIQQSRKPIRQAVRNSPVIGFHFKCESDYEVTPDGPDRFWSGVWVVAEDLCTPAVELGGYVALHASKRERSYRQGTIIDWKVEPRSKGTTPMGITFLLHAFDEPQPWFGTGTGEKGYRRIDDLPSWTRRLVT